MHDGHVKRRPCAAVCTAAPGASHGHIAPRRMPGRAESTSVPALPAGLPLSTRLRLIRCRSGAFKCTSDAMGGCARPLRRRRNATTRLQAAVSDASHAGPALHEPRVGNEGAWQRAPPCAAPFRSPTHWTLHNTPSLSSEARQSGRSGMWKIVNGRCRAGGNSL